MRATILSAAAAAALLVLFSGCCSCGQNSSDVARGQSPATATASGDEWCEDDCDDAGNCRHCWGQGCCHCRPYRVPRDLRYPPQANFAAGSAGIIQYPYYTCKGPDCFFAEPNPVRKP